MTADDLDLRCVVAVTLEPEAFRIALLVFDTYRQRQPDRWFKLDKPAARNVAAAYEKADAVLDTLRLMGVLPC